MPITKGMRRVGKGERSHVLLSGEYLVIFDIGILDDI